MNECNKYQIKLDSKLLTVSLRKDGATVIYLFALALRYGTMGYHWQWCPPFEPKNGCPSHEVLVG